MSSDQRHVLEGSGHSDRPHTARAWDASVATADRGSEGSSSSAWGDPRVAAALEEYLSALEAGCPPSREEFLDRHASIAWALKECLSGLEFVRSIGWRFDEGARCDSSGGPGGPGMFMAARLGDYRILREVGRGGMGVVYEAEQVSLGRRVALEGPPVRRRARPPAAPAVPDRGPGRGPAAPPAHRAGVRRRLRAGRPLLRHAVHRRPDPGRARSASCAEHAEKFPRPGGPTEWIPGSSATPTRAAARWPLRHARFAARQATRTALRRRCGPR